MLNKKRIAIFVGFLCCLFFMTTFAGGTAQNTVIATRLVTFIDGYNNSTVSEQTIEVGTDAEVPNDPRHEGLVFAGWYRYDDQDVRVTDFTNILEDTRVIAKYAGDLNGNGIADDEETRYTITFRDSFDGRILGTEQVLPGMSATAPNVPTHEGRTFVGWSGNYANVTRNATIETVYTVDAPVTEAPNPDPAETVVEERFYTVTFIDGDTDEVIVEARVREGLTADTPTIPEHEKRVFDRFEGDYSNVTSDRTVRVIYTDDLNGDGVRDYLETHYTVEFVVLPYLGGVHGKFEANSTLRYENLVAGLTFEQAGITIPNAVPENEHYSIAWKQVTEDAVIDWDSTQNVTVNGNLTYAVVFVPDVDTNKDGIADSEQTYTLTINRVSKGTNGTYTLGKPEVKSVIAGTKVDLSATITGYKVIATQKLMFTMPAENTEVTVYYYVDGNDENGNGKNDAEETYTLTINRVSQGANGTYTLGKPEVKSVIAGTKVDLSATITGYKVNATQELMFTMPAENTEVTVYYHVDGNDENENGKNDTEETYKLTVNYVSVGEKETHTLETVTREILVGTEVIIEKDFTGYTVKANQPKKVTMPEEDKTVTIEYTVNGKDSNGNGKNDDEETYKLTVNYVSVGTKSNTTLDTLETNVVAGTEVTVEKEFKGYTVKANQPKTITMPEENKTVTIEYTVDGNDENGNGKNDAEETYKLTVNYVSVGEKEIHALDTVETNVIAGTEYPIERNFDGYTVKANQPKMITMPAKNTTVTVEYTADKDKNGNGQNDNEETHKLTINYVSVGEKEIHALETVTKEVLAGTEVTVEKEFKGYTVKANQLKTITMPAEEKIVTIEYTVNGKDENGNGKNDAEETYKLTVNYVSVGEKGTYTLASETKNVIAGTIVDLEKTFDGYVVNDEQELSIIMPEENKTITIYYHVNGKDENGNGKNDAAETYTLTINRISKGTKSNTTLTVETISVLAGTKVDLAKDITGYVLEDNQELSLTMPEKNVEAIVYYTVNGKDENGNGKNDTEETYTLTIRYVNKNGVELAPATTQSLLVGTEVIATPIPVENYTPVETSKTVVMPNSNHTVTLSYTADIVGIKAVDNGNMLEFKQGVQDETALRNKITVYLVDVEGNLVSEVTDYTTDFNANGSTREEHKLTIKYNYNGKILADNSLAYILTSGEVSENGFDITYNEGATSYKIDKYPGGSWLGTKDQKVDYEFVELTQNYFGNVTIIEAKAYYDDNTSAELEISQRIRYRFYGLFSGNYYNSVFIVNRKDKQTLVKNGSTKIETIVISYTRNNENYRMIFEYTDGKFVVNSNERVN